MLFLPLFHARALFLSLFLAPFLSLPPLFSLTPSFPFSHSHTQSEFDDNGLEAARTTAVAIYGSSGNVTTLEDSDNFSAIQDAYRDNGGVSANVSRLHLLIVFVRPSFGGSYMLFPVLCVVLCRGFGQRASHRCIPLLSQTLSDSFEAARLVVEAITVMVELAEEILGGVITGIVSQRSAEVFLDQLDVATVNFTLRPLPRTWGVDR